MACCLCQAHSHVVVTEETKKQNRLQISNVCSHFSIPCVSTFQMLDKEGAQFILDS